MVTGLVAVLAFDVTPALAQAVAPTIDVPIDGEYGPMSLGRHESAMRSMIRGGGGLIELSGKEINDVIAYIKEGKE